MISPNIPYYRKNHGPMTRHELYAYAQEIKQKQRIRDIHSGKIPRPKREPLTLQDRMDWVTA